MTKNLIVATERSRRVKAPIASDFNPSSHSGKTKKPIAMRNIIEWFVKELKEETLVNDYLLSTLADHLFFGILSGSKEAETAAERFVSDIKQKKSTYPAVIINEWISSKALSIQMAEVFAKEMIRPAQEVEQQLKELHIQLPLTEETGHALFAKFNLKAVEEQCAEYIATLNRMDKHFREWLELSKNSTSINEVPPLLTERAHPLQNSAVMKVPNSPADVLFAQKITDPKSWLTNENDCYKYVQDSKTKAIVIYSPEEEITDFREIVLQSLENRFAAMKGELVADVADILFWHWLANGRESYANITLSQILEYRGVEPRPNVIEEHSLAMRDISAFKLRGSGIENEKLFHISSANLSTPKLGTIYRYHPGYFLSEAIQSDLFFLAYYARSVWQLDYYRDANAKKLARVLRADWRRNAEAYLPTTHPLSKPSRYRTWKALLADAGIDTQNGLAKTNPTRFIESIERELEKLFDADFVRDRAKSPEIYHADDVDKLTNLPRKNRLAIWLNLRTCITPSVDITDALAKTATRRLALKAEAKLLAERKETSKRTRKKAA